MPILVALWLIAWQSSLSLAAHDWPVVLANGVEAVLFVERFVWLALGLGLASMLMWQGRAALVALIVLAIASTIGGMLDRSIFVWCEAAVQVAVLAGIVHQFMTLEGFDKWAMASPLTAHAIGTIALHPAAQTHLTGVEPMAAPHMITQALMIAMIAGMVSAYSIAWRRR